MQGRGFLKKIYFKQTLLVILFGYLSGLLVWGIVTGKDITSFLANNIRGGYPTYYIILTTIFLFGMYLFSRRQSNPGGLQETKILFWLILAIYIAISLPYIKIFQVFNLPWFNFDWIASSALPIRVFVLSVSLSVFLIVFFFRNIDIKKIYAIPSWSVYILVGIICIAYILQSIIKHNHFGTVAWDFGLADQVIWHYSKFHIPAPSTIRGLSNIWGDHFHPIWILFAPLFWIWDDARMLLIIDPIIAGIGAIYIFKIACKYLKNNLIALVLTFSYLTFFGLQNALDFPFRGDTIAAALLALAFYFILEKKWLKYYIVIFFILCCKESFSLYVTFLGIWLIVKKEYKAGIVSLILGILWWFLIIKYLIPSFLGSPYPIFTYQQLGNNYGEVLKTVLTNPIFVLKVLFNPAEKMNTILVMLASFGFLSVFAPSFLIVAIPMLGERFLSSNYLLWLTVFHYSVTIAPVLAVSCIFGIKKIISNIKRPLFGRCNFLFISITLVLISIFFSQSLSLPLARLRHIDFYKTSSDQLSIYRAIKEIPSNASVAAQDTIVPHLSHRENIFLYGGATNNADYVILNIKTGFYPMSEDNYKNSIRQLLASRDYGIKKSEKSTILFQKGLKSELGPSQEILDYINSQ